MLKNYDTSQQAWEDVNSLKRYDANQQAWIDVYSAKRYEAEKQAWEEAMYKFMFLDSYGAYNGSTCNTVDKGLGVYATFYCTASSYDVEPWFQFKIDNLRVPAGSTLKFRLEGSAVYATAWVGSGTAVVYSNNNIMQTQDFEVTIPNYDSSEITWLTISIHPIPTATWDSTCTGYIRNVEIGGVKLKFPNI